MVSQQDQKSQQQNKLKAMEVLRARLLDRMIAEQEAARSRDRRAMVGTGDRSAKIRTYNFPQSRVTDHRINLSVHNLADVIDGTLDELVDALRMASRQEQDAVLRSRVTRRALLAEATATLAGGRRDRAAPRGVAALVRAQRRYDRRSVVLDGGMEAEPSVAAALREAVRRRAAGEPLAHVGGADRLPRAAPSERPPGAHSPSRDRRAGGSAARAGCAPAASPTSGPAAAVWR